MTEVEDAVKTHLAPLQERAGAYVDDSRFELMRNGGRVYPVPGGAPVRKKAQEMEKWPLGNWPDQSLLSNCLHISVPVS